MVLTAKGRYTYIPKFNGNRDLPEREQITVEIIRPRIEERNQLQTLDFARDTGLVDLERPHAAALTLLRPQYRVGQILRNHVGIIKNLSVEEDGKIRVITNGMELAECTAFGALNFIQELTAEILSDQLTESEKKSLPSPLSSSMKDGPENNGTPPTTTKESSSVSDSLSGENSEIT